MNCRASEKFPDALFICLKLLYNKKKVCSHIVFLR